MSAVAAIRGGAGRRALLVALACATAALPTRAAQALVAQAPAPVAAAAPVPSPYDNTVRGAIADGGIGTSMAGDTLMFELGGQWAGLRVVRDRRWLLQWDALVALRGGYLANQHPYMSLIGWHELAWGEAGFRFLAPRRWSPYAGLRLGNELTLMKHPGLAWSDLDTINSVDNVGGTVAAGLIRVTFGASWLDGQRSWLVLAFIQEELNAAQTNTPAQAFAGIGVGARFDVARSLSASVEASWGVAPERRDSLRALTDQTSRSAGVLTFRKTFANEMWAGLSTFIARDSDHIVYFVTGNVYDTSNAPRFGVSLLYGFPIGRRK